MLLRKLKIFNVLKLKLNVIGLRKILGMLMGGFRIFVFWSRGLVRIWSKIWGKVGEAICWLR